MRASRPGLALAGALLSLSLMAGCEEERDLSPSYEDRIPPGLTLAQEDRKLASGRKTVLRGVYERAGDRLAGEPITLEHDPYRFDDQYEAIAETTSDERGRYRFAVEPTVNTDYRVTAGDLSQTHSRDARVIVLPRISVDRREHANGAVSYTTTLAYAPEVLLGSTLVRHYAADAATAAETGRLSLVGTTAPRRVRPGLSRATYELPPFASGFRYESCVALAAASAIGARDSRCAGETLRVGREGAR